MNKRAGKVALMLCYLREGASCTKISEEMEMHYNTVHGYIKQFKRYRLIHISGYIKNVNGVQVVYKLGDLPDAERPKNRDHFRRIKNDSNPSH